MSNLVSLAEASEWASSYLEQEITRSNISYLIQYGKIKRHQVEGKTKVNIKELKEYYENNHKTREKAWKKELGDDLNWNLSFDKVPERKRTKHVHRLHQYKGKFIPQLVEYFLDAHTDEYKQIQCFKPGEVILDPFAGSGTTLIQANELGIHGIGIDISAFNCLITKAKIAKYNIEELQKAVDFLIEKIDRFQSNKIDSFRNDLYEKMNDFNHKYFPNGEFKRKINQGKINKKRYIQKKEGEFLDIYQSLLDKYKIVPYTREEDSFLDKWYIDNVRNEIEHVKGIISKGRNENLVDLLKVILSRTSRSCRATPHYNLARLQDPQTKPYYCRKHKKICKPIYSLRDKFKRYASGTINRIKEFSTVRGETEYAMLLGDSRKINLPERIKRKNPKLYDIIKSKGVSGVFTSPPYVGQIDYHEQHAYAYELFNLERRDKKEIGPLFRGKGKKARKMYIEGISEVLKNIKPYLSDDYNIFLVANDKFNLYPRIVEKAGMKIVEKHKRPVLNRTSRDRNPYSEIIFHIKS